MTGPAAKGKHGAALSRNRFHHAKGKPGVFEHRPLFDVKLKISATLRMMPRGNNIRMGGSITVQRREHRNAVCIPAGQVRWKQLVDKRAAANERQAVTHTLFIGEADYFDTKVQSPSIERLSHRKA